MSYTYRYTIPSGSPPFKTIIRRTRGKYVRTTEPSGVFGFRYAVFQNRASEVWVPVHDLTPETKAAIAEGR
jgi:hypothetical protein